MTDTDIPAATDAAVDGVVVERPMKHGAPELLHVALAVFRAAFADDEDEGLVRAKWHEWEDDRAKAIRTAHFVIRSLGGWGSVLAALTPAPPATESDATVRMRERWEKIDQLRNAEEGNSVELLHDNPDKGSANGIIFRQDFGWKSQSFLGCSIDDCLDQALTALGETT